MARSLRARLLPARARLRLVPPPSGRRFGKLAPPPMDRSVSLERHMAAANLPAPPSTLKLWLAKLPSALGMMLNDRLGDCTCAGVGHAIQTWTANASSIKTITDSVVLKLYELVSGYDPVTGANDNGAVEQTVLEAWRTKGVSGHKIVAYGRVDHTNETRVRQVIQLFGLAYIGTQVPAAWEQGPEVWDVATGAAGQIVGGHCVILVGYDSKYYYLVSWGRVYKMTRAAFLKYVDEVWGVVTVDWIRKDAYTPSGLNLAALLQDIHTVQGS